MGLFTEFKNSIRGNKMKPSAPAAPIGQSPTERSIYQSRQNFGVNFGSLFVLEKYIFDGLYIQNTSAELDAVCAMVERDGIEKTRQKFENHWTSYCSDEDWQWLKQKGVQSIRIPIGYWMIGNGIFTEGTNFERVAQVYNNAWNILKTHYIEKAKEFRISILVDLHALPKGANTGDHSGEWFKEAGFWNSGSSIDLAVRACRFIGDDLQNFDNISGIQIVNESVFDNNPKGQINYYVKAISAIREVNKDVPVIISDGWWPDQWVKFLNDNSNGNIGNLGVVIDHHVYRCFSDDDKSKDVDQIIDDVNGSVLVGLSAEADFIIGEYSCVLDGQTWDKSKNVNRGDKVREYGQRQYQTFKDRATAGTYFWTFKFEHGDGGEWGFKPMIETGCIPLRPSAVNLPSQQTFEDIFNQHFQNHQNYWLSQNPNESYEFWRYQEGFITAWNDALAFCNFDNSRIGRVVAWKNARLMEHIKARGESRHLWEWHAGFQEALSAFSSL